MGLPMLDDNFTCQSICDFCAYMHVHDSIRQDLELPVLLEGLPSHDHKAWQ